MATNSTQENARVLWDCYITDAAGTSVSIVLDDSTNKMLSFSMNARIKTNDDDNDAYGENFDESASSDGEVYATKNVFDEDTLWSSLETYVGTLKNYYGFKEARLLNIAESDNYYSDSSILNTVVFIDGKGSETECEIVLSADSFLQVYFNGFGRSKASVNLTTTVN